MPPTVNVPEEPAFADNLDDSSDILIAIVKSHIISASQTIPEGFGTHDDGPLCRLIAVEITDFDLSQELEVKSRDPRPVVTLELGQRSAGGCLEMNQTGIDGRLMVDRL